MPSQDLAVEALIARQGRGARYDAPNAPADDLLLARRGTAFLARKIMELSDEELYLPSRRPGQSRARLIAAISCDARQQATVLESLRLESLGLGRSDGPAPESAIPDLDLAATLPARALRHLFQHSTVHLNVVWRDLLPNHWDHTEQPGTGGVERVRDLPFKRAGMVWQCAIDLRNGARLNDAPARVFAPTAGLAKPAEQG